MIGPPLRKLSIKKLPVNGGPAGIAAAAGLADAEAAGERPPLRVALTLAPGPGDPPSAPAGDTPKAGDPPTAGGPGGIAPPGAAEIAGAAGFVTAGAPGAPGAPGFVAGGIFCPAGGAAALGGGGGGAAGLFCANEVNAIKLRQSVSNVFISAAEVELPAPFAVNLSLFQTERTRVQQILPSSIGGSRFP
jgi:hypothetical protein